LNYDLIDYLNRFLPKIAMKAVDFSADFEATARNPIFGKNRISLIP